MNVLNLQDIDRELRRVSAHSAYPQVKTWVKTVVRNYIINLSPEEAAIEYSDYQPVHGTPGARIEFPVAKLPTVTELPTWAQKAVDKQIPIHVFNPHQVRRRKLWKSIEAAVDWFNMWQKDDPALNRLSKMDFPTARKQGEKWRAEIDAKPWDYVLDAPPVFMECENKMRWVHLVLSAHFVREGKCMNHCVGSASYVMSSDRGVAEFYSLRDAKNEPHITIEVKVGGESGKKKKGQDMRAIAQIKGKQNSKPAPKYQPYLAALIAKTKWPVIGDGHNVDVDSDS